MSYYKENSAGFAGLSSTVSDGTTPDIDRAAASANYQLISLDKYPSLAAPWSGDGPGEGWKWGDYFFTVQTRPVTVQEFLAKMMGEIERWDGLVYQYSATVFRDPEKNIYGKSSRPVLVIAIEKSEFATMLGVFDGDIRSNLGTYDGRLDVDSARRTFIEFIGQRFNLTGKPERLGTIEAIRTKVVTRDLTDKLSNGNSLSSSASVHTKISATRHVNKSWLRIAALVSIFLVWGFFTKPNFLAFAFGYENFQECMLHRMQGQPSNLFSAAKFACNKTNPPETNINKSRLEIVVDAKSVLVKKKPNGVRLTRVDGHFYENGCSDLTYLFTDTTYPDVVVKSKKEFFADIFVFDIPDKFNMECAKFFFYGIESN